MKYKYRTRIVEKEAFQMTKERRKSNSDWPNWLSLAWQKKFNEPSAVSCEDHPHSKGDDRLIINTLEGMHMVNWDDYIIQGLNGELYPCKPDIFEKTYEWVG